MVMWTHSNFMVDVASTWSLFGGHRGLGAMMEKDDGGDLAELMAETSGML